MMKSKISISIVAFILLVMIGLLNLKCSSGSKEDSNSNGKPGFFSSIHQQSPITASLHFDLDSVVNNSDNEKEVQGTLILNLDSLLSIPVELRSRGVTRKKLCSFPPMRLQIKKAPAREHGWSKHREYKLVTHCFDTVANDEYLLREYLAYKIYEELSDICFRTQLFHFDYITPSDTFKHFGFIIENEKEMNKRLGLEEMDVEKQRLSTIHVAHYQRFALFQFMVGNTDWNLKGHNTKFVLQKDSETPIVIPYDFDYSGFVNAWYARPFESLPIENVRERYFMYRGKKDHDFTEILMEFNQKKESITDLIEEFPYISTKCKGDIINYINSFYEIISMPDWKDQIFPTPM